MMLNKNNTINMTMTPSIDPLMSGLLKAIWAEIQMAINKNSQKEGFNKLPIVNKLSIIRKSIRACFATFLN